MNDTIIGRYFNVNRYLFVSKSVWGPASLIGSPECLELCK